MNNDNYEKILSEEIGIPNVSLSNLTIEQAKDVTEALILIFNKYPDLKNSLCAIDNAESINDQMNLVSFSVNPNEKWDEYIPDGSNMIMCTLKYSGLNIRSLFNMASVIFAGLSFGDKFLKPEEFEKQQQDGIKLGIVTKYTATTKGVVCHEMGHLLDKILNISNSKEFEKILSSKRWNILTEIDFHAGTSLQELFAEAFSEYILNPNPSELVHLIGQLIDKKYIESKGKNIFNINYRYKDFLEKAENEMSGKKR